MSEMWALKMFIHHWSHSIQICTKITYIYLARYHRLPILGRTNYVQSRDTNLLLKENVCQATPSQAKQILFWAGLSNPIGLTWNPILVLWLWRDVTEIANNVVELSNEKIIHFTVVVALLAEQLLPTPDDQGSNPVNGNFYWTITYLLWTVCWKDKNIEK